MSHETRFVIIPCSIKPVSAHSIFMPWGCKLSSISQAGRDATADDEITRELVKAGINLVKITRGEQRKGLQVGWVKTMVRTGKQDEVESLDTSVLAMFDQRAGEFWRSIQALVEAGTAVKENDTILVDKATVKNLMLNLVQVYSVNQDEMKAMGFKNILDTLTTARNRAVLTLSRLYDAMQHHKKLLGKGYTNLKGIVPAMGAASEADVRSILTDLSMQGEAEAQSLIQGMLSGSPQTDALPL